MARSENKFAGILIGPIVIAGGMMVLWKNEGRFDYHRAAKRTDAIVAPGTDHTGKLISYTESMKPDLTMRGEYVESLVGYLTVTRSAQVYAWDRDEDDEGHVSWDLEWMSQVQSNSRNNGIRQQLSSRVFRPKSYDLGELSIDANSIEFVDAHRSIPVSSLALTDVANRKSLAVRGEYLYLAKSRSRNLGDERIAYQGIPVPSTATYFGKYEQGRGTAHQAEPRGGLIDGLIHDTGVLHHLVAGERSVALQTMKAHLVRLKWIVRGAGFLGVSIGFMILFSSVAGFLYHLPLIGSLAQWGVLALSFLMGGALSIVTISASYLIHHPIVFVGTLAIGGILFYLARKRASESQQRIKQSLDRDLGHRVSKTELEELEFIELVRLALADQTVDIDERKYLGKWAKKHRWDRAKLDEMVAKARSGVGESTEAVHSARHLENLIRLALADGNMNAFELKTISRVANEIGYGRADVQRIVKQIRHSGVA